MILVKENDLIITILPNEKINREKVR